VLLARAFPRAGARYAIIAVAFVAAASEPLAAVLLSGRLTPHANLALPLERLLAGLGSLDLIFAVVGAITIVLLGDVAFAFYRLLMVKREALVDAAFGRGTRRAPVAYSADVRSATAIGYRRPCVVLPAGLESRVDAGELRAIIAHENAHLARYDDWAKALQAIVVRALWFAPALWILARRLDLERELASDERVAATLDPRAYAACLLRLAVDVPGRHLAPAAWRGRAQIAVRVEELLRPARRLGAGGVAVRLTGLAGAIVAGAFGAGALVPTAGPVAVPLVARAPHERSSPMHAAVRRHGPVAASHTVAEIPDAPDSPAVDRPPVLAVPLAAVPLVVPVAPAVPRRRTLHRPRPVVAALPAPADAPASEGVRVPCRTCATLRRPSSDGPAMALPRPAVEPVEQPAPEPSDATFGGARRPPAEPNSAAPSWPGLLY